MPLAGRNRPPLPAAASGGWRCRWCPSLRRQVEGGGRPSWRASAKAAVPQAFLETAEDRLLIARLDIDHTRSGMSPACARAGANRAGRVMHHKTFPLVRAATPAVNTAPAATAIAASH